MDIKCRITLFDRKIHTIDTYDVVLVIFVVLLLGTHSKKFLEKQYQKKIPKASLKILNKAVTKCIT